VPSFRSGDVVELVAERPGLQRVLVDLEGSHEPAYVLTQLIGDVAVGDRVIVNTTAVELGLGTGGWHVVHWNLSRNAWHEAGPGSVMKLRYTSLQVDTGSSEDEIPDVVSLDGMPVVAVPLHSQVAAVAVAIRNARPNARIAYVMTDGGALPVALSDLVWQLRERDLIDVTVTAGHAFGGDYEAVSVPSALAVAAFGASADVAIVAMGPGSAGTGTRLGFSGIELGGALDAVTRLGGVAIAALRVSDADPRDRHRGVSHHSTTVLTLGSRGPVIVAVPDGITLDREIRERHIVVEVPRQGIVERMEAHGLAVESMGRPAADDALLFECGAAAGIVASEHIT
jgi:hypothetical protein